MLKTVFVIFTCLFWLLFSGEAATQSEGYDAACHLTGSVCIDGRPVGADGRVAIGVRNISVGCTASRIAHAEYRFREHTEISLSLTLVDSEDHCEIRNLGGSESHSVFCEHCSTLKDVVVSPHQLDAMQVVKPAMVTNFSIGGGSIFSPLVESIADNNARRMPSMTADELLKLLLPYLEDDLLEVGVNVSELKLIMHADSQSSAKEIFQRAAYIASVANIGEVSIEGLLEAIVADGTSSSATYLKHHGYDAEKAAKVAIAKEAERRQSVRDNIASIQSKLKQREGDSEERLTEKSAYGQEPLEQDVFRLTVTSTNGDLDFVGVISADGGGLRFLEERTPFVTEFSARASIVVLLEAVDGGHISGVVESTHRGVLQSIGGGGGSTVTIVDAGISRVNQTP